MGSPPKVAIDSNGALNNPLIWRFVNGALTLPAPRRRGKPLRRRAIPCAASFEPVSLRSLIRFGAGPRGPALAKVTHRPSIGHGGRYPTGLAQRRSQRTPQGPPWTCIKLLAVAACETICRAVLRRD